jgi:hypothetical protein
MNPRHGEVWLADMGMTAKTRPAVVLLADNLKAPRSLIIHIPITRQNYGSELEVPLECNSSKSFIFEKIWQGNDGQRNGKKSLGNDSPDNHTPDHSGVGRLLRSCC